MNPTDPNFSAWSKLLSDMTFQAFLVACVLVMYRDARAERQASRESTKEALQEFAASITALAAALEKQAEAIISVYSARVAAATKTRQEVFPVSSRHPAATPPP